MWEKLTLTILSLLTLILNLSAQIRDIKFNCNYLDSVECFECIVAMDSGVIGKKYFYARHDSLIMKSSTNSEIYFFLGYLNTKPSHSIKMSNEIWKMMENDFGMKNHLNFGKCIDSSFISTLDYIDHYNGYNSVDSDIYKLNYDRGITSTVDIVELNVLLIHTCAEDSRLFLFYDNTYGPMKCVIETKKDQPCIFKDIYN